MLKTLSIVGYLGMIGCFFGLLAMHTLFASSPLGISVQAGAFLLLLWSRVTFGRRSYHVAANPTEGGLVTAGPYRYIRHPIYAACCLFALAGVMTHLSWETGLCGGLVLGCAVMRIFSEETLVATRYPEYRRYRTTTWRMIPHVF
jgi:protein-S-isoprenylcysteine O-methyltransferase Ste14